VGSDFVALALASPEEEKLWQGILDSQGITAFGLTNAMRGAEALAADTRLAGCMALLADAPVLLSRGIAPAELARTLRQRFAELRFFVRLPGRTGISAAEQAWATKAGITSLLPGSTVAAWPDSVAPVLERILEKVGRPRANTTALDNHLKALVKSGEEPRAGVVKDIFADAYRLESEGLNALRIFEGMQEEGAVTVADRSYRGKTYRQCFIASEAIDWMQLRFGMSRSLAASVGSFLWLTGHVHHVARDAAFADDYLFFRLGARRADFDRIDLVQVEEAMRAAGGPAIADRSYRGKSYPRSFLGAEAVEWLMRTCRLRLGAAETVGQRLLDLGVFHHVVDEHGFMDESYFYRFRTDEVAPAVR
jgi:hypothetical protein